MTILYKHNLSREVDREYYVHREYLVNYSDVTDQYIIVYWKPPGALNWVEKFTTEKLSGNNLDFVTKVHIYLIF